MKETKLLVVEDHDLTRLGIKLTVEKIDGIRVVAETGRGKDAIDLAKQTGADVILLDIGLPDLDGIEVCKQIKSEHDTKVIFLTSHGESADLQLGLASGADGYCLKSISAQQLEIAIASALEGAIWVDPGIARKLAELVNTSGESSSACAKTVSRLQKLSEREQQVLGLVVRGMSNLEIAKELYLSIDTVKTHMRHLMEKLDVSDRTQLAVLAVRQGL